MSKPAARVGDMHICPQETGAVPHVGGPAAVGSSNVFINGLPAARVGDLAICNGPPDRISEGSATVFINGKAAARMGDHTAHRGIVIRGSSNVFIGDGSEGGRSSASCPVAAKAAGSSLYSDEP